jgi:Fe-S-cluster containining protein
MVDPIADMSFQSPSIPAVLAADSSIRFRCFEGISCFNACCKQADVTLTPYDILRLKRSLGMTSGELLKGYTVPFQMDGDGLPGVKLKTADSGVCLQFNGDDGCRVYEDRPTACRYYPVALLALRAKGASQAEERYSLVKEDHCKGHHDDREISVADYRTEQGCEEYDARNREWFELLLKKRSAGPTVGRPSRTSLQLFFMASYDLDSFRRFVLSDGFKRAYALPDVFYEEVGTDDEALLGFAYRFLRQVLFGERTIDEVANAWEQRVSARQGVWEARRHAAHERRLAEEDTKYAEDCDESCDDK